MIYTTGTIAGSTNTITGTGTTWTAAGSLIRIGCTVIAFTDPVQVFQITAIGSATSLAVTPAANPAIAGGTRYAILLSDSLSVDGLAQDIAETFGMYQRYMSGFADVMNGTGNVTITINGTQVTVPGMQSLAKKGANNDITSLSALATALSVAQGGTGAKDAVGARGNFGFINDMLPMALGGTGAKDAAGARQNLGFVPDAAGATLLPLALGGTGAKDAAAARTNLGLGYGTTAGTVAQGNDIRLSTIDGKSGGTLTSGVTVDSGGSATGMTIIGYGDTDIWHDQISVGGAIRFRSGLTGIGTNPLIMWQARVLPGDSLKTPLLISANDVIYTSRNTTKATDGTLKVASPVVQLFGSGRAEMNEESEGCIVTRIDIGVYKIEGCIGLNADAAWGGINGGFEIPTDRNKQPLIWLDYDVNADGSVLVKTYHREHPSAPAFARNTLDGIADGDPVDIPSDQFISVRVEMPADSIWNLAQAAQENQQDAQQ